MAIVVLANYGINIRLIVPGNAAETARTIMAHETLFRINIACNLIYVVSLVVLLTGATLFPRRESRSHGVARSLAPGSSILEPCKYQFPQLQLLLRFSASEV